MKITKIEQEHQLENLVCLRQEDDLELLNETGTPKETLEGLNWLFQLKYEFWLATINENPVGYIMGRAQDDEYTHQGVFVNQTFRRKGIAIQLTQSLIDYVSQTRYEKIKTIVSVNNISSIGVLQKTGFVLRRNQDIYVATYHFLTSSRRK